MSDRFMRQADLVPRERLLASPATIIGVGAIGRQVALQLASIGIPALQLIDFDIVDESNIATQGYRGDDVGQQKVEALAAELRRIDARLLIEPISDRWRPSLRTEDVVFCCVDSISARSAIWRGIGPGCRFWCDGRMRGEVIRVLSVGDVMGRDHYPATLFPQAEAEPGRCTARSTIYTANVAAGLILHQFTRWLRNLPTDADLTLNLLASECHLGGEVSVPQSRPIAVVV
jgi:sulfur carrier protein ThiS adenylyltransferase